MKFILKNKFLLVIAIILLVIFFVKKKHHFTKKVFGTSFEKKNIILEYNGFTQSIKTVAINVADFLSEQNININNNDILYPQKETILFPGSKIKIIHPKKIFVKINKETKEIYGFKKTVKEIIQENNIKLNENDIIIPSGETIAYNNLKIELIRVKIKKERRQEIIPYRTIEKKDKNLGWQEKKIKQFGSPGIKEIVYEIAYHNNKKVSQKIINSKIIKEPIPKIITKGTFMKIGKKHKGVASWYAHTGTLSAANPWLPMGSYVKVTNLENNKSVVVKINDRGPFGNGRIIDLDKTAFEKIAPLGKGTIKIKMEEILN